MRELTFRKCCLWWRIVLCCNIVLLGE